ncbi:MAG: transketolase [Clostridia bacterium]|nr:transketolase [Clostridia bacterium]
MNETKKKLLKEKAAKIRLGALECVYSANSGHPGGSLSVADLLAYLYFEKMNINPEDPDNPMRDRLVLSKGHTSPALYSALAHRGYFSTELLKTFRHEDSILQGHPDMKNVPGVDMSTGSLGLGISAACGIALSAKVSGDPYRVYTVLGDGESEEGQVWEAAMFAAHYKLDNLIAFLDYNGLQIDGPIAEVINPAPFDEKFKAFGWNVCVIDGHNFDEIDEAVNTCMEVKGKPSVIIMKTVKGKGVSFMENEVEWHGSAPNKEQYETAVAEIEKTL